jgi:hypothetical protein
LALNAAKAIGCQVINIGAQDLIEGNYIFKKTEKKLKTEN